MHSLEHELRREGRVGAARMAEVGQPADGPHEQRAEAGQRAHSQDEASPRALHDTVLWARECYRDMHLWTTLARNGMQQDYSWERSARTYDEVYHRL